MSGAFRLTGEPLAKLEQDFNQALINADFDSMELLLAEGANIDIDQARRDGFTALRIAIALGTNVKTEIFLAKGAKPNQADQYGNTPLHTAATYKNLTATQMLLEAGATTRVRNLHGLSPLRILVLKKQEDISMTRRITMMEALLNAGADPDDDDYKTDFIYRYGYLMPQEEYEPKTSYPPLFYAAIYGLSEVVRTLLKFVAGQRYYASGSRTPLHVAAENGHVEVVRALLENAGTDMEIINAETDHGSTLLLNLD